MTSRATLKTLLALGAAMLVPGCSGSTAHWAQTTDRLALQATDVRALDVTTHNGSITVTGRNDGSDDIKVTVERKGGGSTVASAEACRDAIGIVSQQTDDGTYRLGWQLKGARHHDWATRVSFEVSLPARLAVRATTYNGRIKIRNAGDAVATTHNGGVTVEGISGTCDITTYNGGVRLTEIGEASRVATHNGGIVATDPSGDVNLETYNGGIEIDARRAPRLAGNVRTHNGGVYIRIGSDTSAAFDCQTHKGGINCGPCSVTSRSPGDSTICVNAHGTDKDEFTVRTYNGGIRIDG